MLRVAVALLALTLVLALAVLRPPTAQPARKTIKMGTVGLESVYYSPVVLAMQKGYFQQEGLQVEPVKLSDPDLVRAVAAGSLMVLHPGSADSTQATKGSTVKLTPTAPVSTTEAPSSTAPRRRRPYRPT